MQTTASSTNASGATNSDVNVTIRDEDVICGRGNPSKQPGNRTFLSIVSKRKDEYSIARNHKAKEQIARGVLKALMQTSDPPPRFLTPVDGIHSLAKTMNASGEGLWRELDEKETMNKVKMALRQKPKVSSKTQHNESVQQEEMTASKHKEKVIPDDQAIRIPSPEITTSAVGSTQQTYDELFAPNDIFLPEADVELAENGADAASDLVDDLDQLFNTESSLGEIVDPTSISGTADNYKPDPLVSKSNAGSSRNTSSAPRLSPLLGSAASDIATASAESDTPAGGDSRQGKIIATLHAARVILRNNLKSLQIETNPDDIESLGRALYRMLTGISLPQRSHITTDQEGYQPSSRGDITRRIFFSRCINLSTSGQCVGLKSKRLD